MNLLKELRADEKGVSTSGYALLMGLIAVATIGAITAQRDQITMLFNDVTSTLSTAVSGPGSGGGKGVGGGKGGGKGRGSGGGQGGRGVSGRSRSLSA